MYACTVLCVGLHFRAFDRLRDRRAFQGGAQAGAVDPGSGFEVSGLGFEVPGLGFEILRDWGSEF